MTSCTTRKEVIDTYKPGDMVYLLRIITAKSFHPCVRGVSIVHTHVDDYNHEAIISDPTNPKLIHSISDRENMVLSAQLQNTPDMHIVHEDVMVSKNINDMMPQYRTHEMNILKLCYGYEG